MGTEGTVLYLRMTDDREGGGEIISRLQCCRERYVERQGFAQCVYQARLHSISGVQLFQLNFPLNDFYKF